MNEDRKTRIEVYKQTKLKRELLNLKEQLEEYKREPKEEKPKQKRLTCVELKKEILDLHDRMMEDN